MEIPFQTVASWESLEDSEFDAEEDAREKARMTTNPTLDNFCRCVTCYLFNYRTYRSTMFKLIWDNTRILHSLPGDGDPEQVLRIFETLLDVISEAEDCFGHDVINPIQYNFLDSVLQQAERMLGRNEVYYQVVLIRLYTSVDPHTECEDLVAYDESCLHNLRRCFPGAVFQPPSTGPPLDENWDEDSIREIRLVYSIGLFYSKVGCFDEAKNALERALSLSQAAEKSEVYLRARLSDAVSDLVLCWSRVLRALADVSIKQGDPRGALAHLKAARSLELDHAEDLRLPLTYIEFLQAVDYNLQHAQLRQLELHNYNIPPQYWDSLVLLVQAHASLLQPAEEALATVQWAVQALQARLPDSRAKRGELVYFSEMTRNWLYSLLLQTLRLQTGALHPSWEQDLEAHLDFIKEIRLRELKSPEYLSVLRQAVKIMRRAVQSGADVEDLGRVRDAADVILAPYCIHVPEQEPEVGAVAASILQLVADYSHLRGAPGYYLKYSFLARYAELVSSKEEEFDEVEEDEHAEALKQKAEKRLTDLMGLLIRALTAEGSYMSQQLAESIHLVFQSMKDLEGVCVKLRRAPPPNCLVTWLAALAKPLALNRLQLYLSNFNMLLHSREMAVALTQISGLYYTLHSCAGNSFTLVHV
jgi:tetratricopeptide (TPR) repeat protein